MEDPRIKGYNPDPKIRRRARVAAIAVFILLVVFALFSYFNYKEIQSGAATGAKNYGLIFVFIAVFLFELIPQIFNAILGVIAASVAGINIHLALITAIIASILGSYLGFKLGKKYGFHLVWAFLEKETIIKTLKFWDKYGKVIVLLGALEPLPYFPLVFGALHMKTKDFILWGMIPRAIGLIALGYGFYFGWISLF